MDDITRRIMDLIRLLQNVSEEDCYDILEGVDINELKEGLGSWFVADYPLYKGS
jgi:hypothetical protein